MLLHDVYASVMDCHVLPLVANANSVVAIITKVPLLNVMTVMESINNCLSVTKSQFCNEEHLKRKLK